MAYETTAACGYELTTSGTFKEVHLPIASPRPDDIVAAVHLVGICGSDLGVYLGRHPYKRAPAVLGHEMCGHVVAVGSGVSRVRVGDHITTSAFCPCGSCSQCSGGMVNLCEGRTNLSHEDWPGCFATHVVLREPMITVLPHDMPHEQGTLVEPLSIAWHALQRPDTRPQHVAVIGAGGIGAATVLLAHRAGATKVTAIDRGVAKERLARKLGASCFLDAGDLDDRAKYTDVNADLTVVTSGHPSCLTEALELTRPRGQVVVVSYSGSDVAIPLDGFVGNEITLLTSHLAVGSEVEEIVTMLSNGLDASRLITHRFPIHDVEAAFDLLTSPEGVSAGRVVLENRLKEDLR